MPWIPHACHMANPQPHELINYKQVIDRDLPARMQCARTSPVQARSIEGKVHVISCNAILQLACRHVHLLQY